MRKRRWIVVAAIAGVLALVVGACGDDGGESTTGAELPIVKFQALPADTSAIPLLAMIDNGFDTAHGFKAEILTVDPDAATNTLLIGESDVATEQDAVNATLAAAEGHKILLFAPAMQMSTGIVVPQDSTYQTPADLIGQKVGHFGVDSGTTSTIAVMLAEIYGIDVFTQYDLREAGPEALPELLKSGEVEAIFDYEPLALRAVNQTPGRYLFQPAKAWREHSGGWGPWLTNLVAREEWLLENEDLALGVRDAWIEGMQFVIDNNYELLRTEPYKSFLQFADDAELESFITYCVDLPCFVPSWTQNDIDQLNSYLELFAARDILFQEMAPYSVAVVLEDLYGR